MEALTSLEKQLSQILLVDRARLQRKMAQLREHAAGAVPGEIQRQLANLKDDVQSALERRQQRESRLPNVGFSGDLPIDEHRAEIQRALSERQTVIVAGETGSGKSTQLPKICLEAGFGRLGFIGHTQPRRIAARSIAARIAEELGSPLGRDVGYKIRFQDRTDPNTFIKLMTDGILLAETQSDRLLNQYELIILDEAHERSLNIDFLIGFLKQTLERRPNLRLIITSATIDAERFSEHFADARGPALVVEVSGRSYPVEIRYRPLADEHGDELVWSEGVIAAVHELAEISTGDVLVFLPTERDIREMARRLRGEMFTGDGIRTTEILPLYARLSARDQNRIFQPSDYRRIVLATNVAESSLTVPNVRFVVDTGTARISRYSPRSKILRLPIESISRASADQRAGRCGRVAAGVCIRLYDEDDFLGRDEYTTPEVRRAHLAAVILQAKALQLDEIEQFPFLDAPRPEAVRDGYKTLNELRAIDGQRRLTALGHRLARLPVDPRIGRLIVGGAENDCLREILIIASALELQDPRERPHDKQQHADERHQRFLDGDSDFLSFLIMWDFYFKLKEDLSRSKLRRACQDQFLSFNRLREWTEIHRQLLDIARQNRLHIGPRRDDYGAIHRALLTGFLSGVAFRSDDREYTGAGGVKLSIWPGSGLLHQRHAWIVAAERVETNRRYVRTVARISPTWIEPIAEHLVKRSYSDPHWSRKKSTVMAYEKVSLMGMPIVVKRRVAYGSIDAETSRRIFLQSGLVEQRMELFDRSLRNNRRVLTEIDQLAARTRQRKYVLDEYTVFAFYDDRIPADVHDVAGMRRWLNADESHRRRIAMRIEDFVPNEPDEDSQEAFPDEIEVGNLRLPVSYAFNRGADDDGVTVTVPDSAVNQLTSDQLDWLVPGLIEEKIVALIRSLPKRVRRNFVPVPDVAIQAVAQLGFGEGSMLAALAKVLTRFADEAVHPDDFQLDKLPDHLVMNVRIVDGDGKVRRTGRDLHVLRSAIKLGDGSSNASSEPADPRWHRDGATDWDFGDLPGEVSIVRGGVAVASFPAVVDRGDAVDLRLFDTPGLADFVSRRGISRLFAIRHQKSIRTQVRWLPEWESMCVLAASVVSAETLRNDVALLISRMAFLDRDGIPRTEGEFRAKVDDGVERIGMAAQEISPILPRLFEAYHAATFGIDDLSSTRFEVAKDDMRVQIESLFCDGFLVDVPWHWVQQYSRYLNGVAYRAERLQSGGYVREDEHRATVQSFWHRYVQQRSKNDQRAFFDPELVEFRWMIEELRVSLFAQELGTSIKISPQRLERQWEKVDTS